MNNLEQLEQNVIEWASEKGIFEKATAIKQGEKTGEEYSEMMRALGKQELLDDFPSFMREEFGGDIIDEIKDAIGDQIVTLIIQAKMQGFTMQECLQSAYDVIKNRKGSMQNGKFVKEA